MEIEEKKVEKVEGEELDGIDDLISKMDKVKIENE